tara:strand:- start:31063 stop:33786 length:2724 start_codon:yes stop_codon:yes gene_type:complete
MTKETLYLIDGSGFIFRAFYAMPPLTRKDGTPVGAVLGFTNMITRLLMEMEANKIAVVFDAKRQTFRNEIYPDYKANRGETPEDLIPQFPLIREVCKAFDLPMLEMEGFEADDLIATYTKRAVNKGYNVTIVSSDKDLMQLVDDGKVVLYDHMKNRFIDEEKVIEKFGVPPNKVLDILSLAGDSSDNIPGVPGIGPKTATDLIKEFGTLENLLENAHTIKQNKRRENLIEFKDQAILSKRLVTLEENVPLDTGLDALHLGQPDLEKVVEFLTEQNFKSLENIFRKKFEHTNGAVWAKPKEAIKPKSEQKYECVQTEEKLVEWVKKCQAAGTFAIDTETNSLNAMQAKLIGISLAVAEGDACYIPINHEQDLLSEKNAQLPMEIIWQHLKPLLINPILLKVGQNIKYDKLVLKKYGVDIHPYDDTMLLSYLLTPGPHNLDELAKRYFDHKMISFKEVLGKSKHIKTFDQVNITEATIYAAEDADYTLRLHTLLKPRIFEEKLTSIYEIIDRPLVDTLVEIESIGFKIDPSFLGELSKEFTANLKEHEKKIYDLAGEEFNIGSPKQLGEILFTKLKLGEGKKGKSGAYATGVDVLEALALDHDLPALILKWRQMAKLINTYTEALVDDINPVTKRVHTSFSMAGTTTGRLASSDPNLQNIPIRTPEGRKIRKAFMTEKGMKLVSFDYSQIELRLLAHFADIKELKQAFLNGQDIHALTASQVFGIPLEKITPDIRSRAKAINFGIIYGISAFGLARQLGISRGEASNYIKAYNIQYPGIQKYMDDMVAYARAHGHVLTLSGRRCYVPNIHSKNGSFRGFAERQAINAPLQGSNADIIKKAMNQTENVLKKNQLDAKLLLQVHDELIFEVPENQVEKIIKVMTDLMENIYKLSIPLKVDSGTGDNWAEAH